MYMVLAAVSLSAPGCSDSPGGGVDAGVGGDGAPAQDAASTDCRLEVRFTLDQEVPGVDATTGTQVDSLSIRLKSFRLISDTTGGSGTPQTTRNNLMLSWSSGEEPSALCFQQAPDGIYQQVLFGVDSYGLSGVLADPDLRDFLVDDEPPSLNGARTIEPSIELTADGGVIIDFEIELGGLLVELDAAKDGIDGDEVEIESSFEDEMLVDALRDELLAGLQGDD